MSDTTQLASVINFLEALAPLDLAEEWDNVGLLLGDRDRDVSRIMTSLTITPEVVEEAISTKVDLVVSHHPLPFRSLKKITTDTISGQLILKLIENRIAVYSPHTAFDSTAEGINQLIAEKIQLETVRPIQPIAGWATTDLKKGEFIGTGRIGSFSTAKKCRQFCHELKDQFGVPLVKFCGDLDSVVSRVAVACGSAGQLISAASHAGCDAFITGETNFHTCLEATALGVSLFLLGHYGSERFAIEILAEKLAIEFSDLSIHASHRESDPIQYVR